MRFGYSTHGDPRGLNSFDWAIRGVVSSIGYPWLRSSSAGVPSCRNSLDSSINPSFSSMLPNALSVWFCRGPSPSELTANPRALREFDLVGAGFGGGETRAEMMLREFILSQTSR